MKVIGSSPPPEGGVLANLATGLSMNGKDQTGNPWGLVGKRYELGKVGLKGCKGLLQPLCRLVKRESRPETSVEMRRTKMQETGDQNVLVGRADSTTETGLRTVEQALTHLQRRECDPLMCRKQEDITWAGSVAGNDPATPRPAGDRELSVPHRATFPSPHPSSAQTVTETEGPALPEAKRGEKPSAPQTAAGRGASWDA